MKKILIILYFILTLILGVFLVSKYNFIPLNSTVLILLELGVCLYFQRLIKKQKLEIKNLNCICDSTRSFRHDFNNIMQALGGYIQTNNMIDLKKYYDKLIPECFKMNNLYRFHSKLMLNPAIYSVISDKYNLAEKNNIKMSLNIMVNLNQLDIDNYSLTRILGILLDNAIEASCEAPKKIINLSFQTFENKQLVIIENTYLNKKVSTKKIFKKDYTTKAKNSGLGLWKAQKIINAHTNLKLHTNAGEDFFSQKLEIS